jgi:hypothetical protein
VTASTLLRLALAGSRTDTLRVALTALSAALATLAVLAAATVFAIPGGTNPDGSAVLAAQYRNNLLAEPGLRPGVALALLLLTIPVLALAAQCGRLGAPARDWRLASFRLAGATPRQIVALVVAETGVASALGTAVGFVVYLVGRELLHRPGPEGELNLPTDVLPATWLLLAVALGLPVVATAVAAALLRRVTVTPFEVVRKVRRAAPRLWPGFLIVAGVAAFAVIEPLGRLGLSDGLRTVVLFAGAVSALLGVVLGTAWISYAAGRLLHRVARRPPALLAARRLMADPWSGSRAFAALLACVMFGAGAAEVRAWLAAHFAAEERIGVTRDTAFYFDSLDLVDAAVVVATAIAAAGLLVTLVESIVSRRRTFAALVATGVPTGVLVRSILWQVFTPLVPATLLSLAVGTFLVRLVATADESAGSSRRCTPSGCVEAEVSSVPIPFDQLALLGAGAVATVVAVVGVGLVFLRSSTAVEELRTT